MIFSSIVFILYFLPIFFGLYFITPPKYRNWILLISSIFFYSWGAPRFIFVILGTTVIDFLLVQRMDASIDQFYRKLFLCISVGINLGLLFYFKYSNFFVENINVLLGSLGIPTISWMKLVLPIGISFYTFETITYVVDVYRRVHKPQPNFWNYQLYIIFFPKLIAGPIVRYHEFANQITNRFYSDTYYNRLAGFARFSIGLGKKVLIANTVGAFADEIFGFNYSTLSTPTAWFGIACYTFQIYFDFSGYSDMALGLSRMMGFSLPENFNSPYTSKSITEFWRRWHITLGAWMKNYLYIPLGGNQVQTKGRLYCNLVLVFLASGFWHGASWNFIFWGGYHGLFLVLERAGLNKVYKKLPSLIVIPLVFVIVMIGWVYFRIENFADANLFVSRMFSFSSMQDNPLNTEKLFYILIALLFSILTLSKAGKRLENYFLYSSDEKKSSPLFLFIVSLILVLLSVSSITSVGFNPFIYFRF